MYQHSVDGVLFTAPDGRVFAANPAACSILGRSEAEICQLGRQRMSDQSDERWRPLLAEREQTGRVRGVARMVRGDGSLVEVEMSAKIFGEFGHLRSCTTIRDVSERLRIERELMSTNARLHELTLTDELTGLRNRRGFLTAASAMLAAADRHGSIAQLIFLDIDNFKKLNDTHGHDAGDAGIRVMGRALVKALRVDDLVSRIGGG